MGVSWPGDGPCPHLPRVNGAAESRPGRRAQAGRKPRPPFPASCTESWQVPWPIACGAVVFLPGTEWPVFPETAAWRLPGPRPSSRPSLCRRAQRHSRPSRCLLSFAARTKSPFSLLVLLLPVFILTFPTSSHLVNNKMKEPANIGSSLFVPRI